MKKLKFIALTAVLLIQINAFSQNTPSEVYYQFTNKILLDATSVKNQQRTGTCWSFCTTSFLESEVIRMGKDTVDLSEMYTVRKTYESKAFNYVLRQGKAQFSQGGLSHDVINSLEQFGLVPESVYNGNQYNRELHNHSEMESILLNTLNGVVSNPNRELTPVWPNVISSILDQYMGADVSRFEYQGASYTPQSFAKKLGLHPDEYISFSSFTHEKYYQPFILQVPDNWSNGQFYNLPLEELIHVIDYALAHGFTIAWDADVSEKTWSRKYGIAIFPENPIQKMSKSEQSQLFISATTEAVPSADERQRLYLNYQTTDDHLMHIIGTAVDQDNNEFYIVKNSWGAHRAYEGYVYVSKSYMAMKTMGILLHKSGVAPKIWKKIN